MGDEIPSRPVRCPYVGRPFLFRCECCKEGIYNGDIFYDIYGKNFHKECIADKYTALEILELVGIDAEIA